MILPAAVLLPTSPNRPLCRGTNAQTLPLALISDPWAAPMDKLPPRYNYFLRCHANSGQVLPTPETMLRWLAEEQLVFLAYT